MDFDPARYGPEVVRILSYGEGGLRPMPLAIQGCSSEDARCLLAETTVAKLFPEAVAPEAAYSGLWLYFGCFEQAHSIAQDVPTAEGSYWHGILHRQEPDPGNAGYWFRRVGSHPIFPSLRSEAAAAMERRAAGTEPLHLRAEWDPFVFIHFCEAARRGGGSDEELARQIQLAEWQLLFDYCARPRR